ncbi:MAG: type II toxin-antitoxin system RelE/ParE family toxin [Nitrospirae bacterium]|nr:type II toxin-antitoxin system RelE/ParE family toxin [Nitrospirota bacterium]MBI3593792.1 type II toxin-antitoxin system RelE/ParE family toxin [Nitrospirota bacterium]
MAICSFSDKATERFFLTGKPPKGVGWSSIGNVVRRKLDMMHYAEALNDLKAPPGNRLESLTGDLKGYFSIRVNYQWRVVLGWTDSGPNHVRVCDYP